MNKPQRSWFDRAFFVSGRTASMVILLISWAPGILLYFFLRNASRDLSLTFFGGAVDVALRFVVSLALTLVVWFASSGIYNLAKFLKSKRINDNLPRHADVSAFKDGESRVMTPNQSSEPTLSSVTPPAGQESRPR